MGRRRKRKRKPRGFSEPETKPMLDPFFNMLDVHGGEKRSMLNDFSVWIALSAALSSGYMGCMVAVEEAELNPVWCWVIGISVGAFVFNVVMGWLEGDRYYRP